MILADDGGLGVRCAEELTALGEACIIVSVGEAFRVPGPGCFAIDPAQPEHFVRLLAELPGAGLSRLGGVIHLWSLDAPPAAELTLSSLEEAQIRGCGAVLHLVQALARAVAEAVLPEFPRLWLVTREAQAVEESRPVSVAQSPLWGLGRVLSYEHPELRCVRMDLGVAGPADPEEVRALLEELAADDGEDEVALRRGERLAHRLVRRPPEVAAPADPDTVGWEPAEGRPFRVETLAPGILDHLVHRASARRSPGPGQVEVCVDAVGLNFMNVMSALGIYPGYPNGFSTLGLECAGTISAVGEGVEGWAPGDEVIAIARHCLGSHALADSRLVARRPARLSPEEAAGCVIAFCTAEYALGTLGRLAEGERVLIHAASGGVGLAALQLARRAGAEVFATAGSDAKRQYLRLQGVQHVLDSRSLSFAEEVMRRTGGEGIDVVLNSLTGEAQARSLELLRPWGRFLELGKRDIYDKGFLSMEPFQRSLTFAAVDLDRMITERPGPLGVILRRIAADLDAGVLKPLPVEVYPVSRVVEAFHTMAQARHIGKIVVSIHDAELRLAFGAASAAHFREDASYLLTGGRGALGLAVAGWMVERGARHLVLAGRGDPSDAAREAITRMEAAGARVVVARADVSRLEDVAAVLAGIADALPPLRGVVHAAGLLEDSILLQTDLQRWRRVMAPKILGAWNLHALTAGMPLDFFVLFSSAAALLGSPGQGSYVAANELLDALAAHRHSLGLPALSIDWGPWAEVGLAAIREDRGGRLAQRGLASLSLRQGLDALARLLAQGSSRVGVLSFDLERWSEFYPAARRFPFFSSLRTGGAAASRTESPEQGHATPVRLLALAPHERLQLLETELAGAVSKVLRLPTARIDLRQPIKKFGLDSLMAVELKHRIETDYAVSVPIVHFLQGLNVADLADRVLEGMDLEEALAPPSALKGSADAVGLLARIDQLSDHEVDALLRDLATDEEAQV